MNEKEKELKAFNQCADALSSLDNKSIFKVFQLLSVHFEFIPNNVLNEKKHDSSQLHHKSLNIPANSEDIVKLSEKVSTKTEVGAGKAKKKGSAKSTPTFMVDLDFLPSGEESLDDFYKKFKVVSNQERNLIFIYYLQEVMKEPAITISHVFSCYKHLRLKIPSFPQTLTDTKHLKGWIETANFNELRVTRNGSNYLEHDKPFRNEA